jgi:tetratricopeptide (TPR) repeat protein
LKSPRRARKNLARHFEKKQNLSTRAGAVAEMTPNGEPLRGKGLMQNWKPSKNLRGLLLVLAVATLWRAVAFWQAGRTPLIYWHECEQSDMQTFLSQARAFAQGDWLGLHPYYPLQNWMAHVAPAERWAHWRPKGVFYQPPLYSYFLALMMLLKEDPAPAARVAQFVLGIMTCGLAYGLGRRLFGVAAGTLAGLLVALHGPLITMQDMLLRETLIAFWVAMTAWLYVAWARPDACDPATPAWRALPRPLVLGALLGLMILLHESGVLLTLALGASGVLTARRQGPRRMAAWLAMLLLGVTIGYMPMIVRAAMLGIPWTPQYAGSAIAFTVANAADAYRSGVFFRGAPPSFANVMDRAQGHLFILIREVLESYRGEWWRWAWNWLQRMQVLSLSSENNENFCYAYNRLMVPILRWGSNFRLLLPLALTGILLRRPRRWLKDVGKGRAQAALLGFMACAALMIGLAIPFSRYRLFLVPLLAVFAGKCGAVLWRAARARSPRPVLLGLGLWGALTLAQWGLDRRWPIGRLRADEFFVGARVCIQLDRPGLAAEQLRMGLERGLGSPRMLFEYFLDLGLDAESHGDHALATRNYEKAVATLPDDPEALASLAWLRAVCPQAEIRNGPEALALARRYASHASKDAPDALDLLAAAEAELGDFVSATRDCERAMAAAKRQGRQDMTSMLAQRLALYRQHKPYRQPPSPPPEEIR